MNPFNKEARLAEIYLLYPRKVEKSRGMHLARKKCQTPEDFDRLELAIRNYALHVNGLEKKYIKYFGSFMSNWEDWLEVDGETELDLEGISFD